MIASEFGSTLQGVGTLITGLAAIGALVRSHQGATKAKVAATEATAAKGIATDTNHVIKDTVVPALTNHENLIQSLATMARGSEERGRLASVFMEDYLARHPEMREMP